MIINPIQKTTFNINSNLELEKGEKKEGNKKLNNKNLKFHKILKIKMKG